MHNSNGRPNENQIIMKEFFSPYKKTAFVALSLLMFSIMGMTPLKAQSYIIIEDLYYQINGDGVSATLIGPVAGTEIQGELNIPSSINYNEKDYTVTVIGKNSFISCDRLTGHLAIPNTVISIGENAFLGCSGLTSLDLGTSLDTIGPAAFYGCKGFTGSLTLPNSVRYIYYAAFYGCNSFTGSLTIGNSLARIEDAAFYKCSGFSSLTIGSAVTSIGTSTFWGCTGLAGSLTIPNTVRNIGPNAFHNCSGLTTLTLGNALDTIGGAAFINCSGLTEVISLATEPPAFSFEEVFEGVNCTTLTVPCGCIAAYEESEWHDYFATIIDDCSKVSELDEQMASVYPNPTNGTLCIEAENIEAIGIFNLLGEKLYEASTMGNRLEYDFGPQGPGVYIVRIQTDKGTAAKRVVVKDK